MLEWPLMNIRSVHQIRLEAQVSLGSQVARCLVLRWDLLWFCGSAVVDASVMPTLLVFTEEAPRSRAALYCARGMFLGEKANASSLFHYSENTFGTLEVAFKEGVVSYLSAFQ